MTPRWWGYNRKEVEIKSEKNTEDQEEYSEFEKDQLVEEILTHSGATIKYKRFQDTVSTVLTGSTANYYVPSKDVIVLAERKQFKGKEGFYRTASQFFPDQPPPRRSRGTDSDGS